MLRSSSTSWTHCDPLLPTCSGPPPALPPGASPSSPCPLGAGDLRGLGDETSWRGIGRLPPAGRAGGGRSRILTDTAGLHAGLAVRPPRAPRLRRVHLPARLGAAQSPGPASPGTAGPGQGPEGRRGSRARRAAGGPRARSTSWAAVCALRGARAGWVPARAVGVRVRICVGGLSVCCVSPCSLTRPPRAGSTDPELAGLSSHYDPTDMPQAGPSPPRTSG